MKEADEIMADVKAAIRDALAARDPGAAPDAELYGALVKSAVRRFINQRFQRKPIVIPVILEV
jgi:mRNA degradation ribonuclease J1/J2